MKSPWRWLWSWTHYLLLTLQFHRSFMISISRITVMNSVGRYHPKKVLEANPNYNFMIAEQTFAWLSRYKKIVCSMDKLHHLFFLHRIITRRNKHSYLCITTGRKVLLPKSKDKTKRHWFYYECMPCTLPLHNTLAYIICIIISITMQSSTMFLHWIVAAIKHHATPRTGI